MSDLISRKALRTDFQERLKNCDEWIANVANDHDLLTRALATRDFICEVIMTINNAPTLEERPKGKWIEVDVRNCHATLKCSVCDRVIEPTFNFGEYSYEDIKTFYPYCHCGAEMRDEEE